MKKISAGILLSTLALFLWGALYWSSPFPFRVVKETAGDAEAGRMLREYFPETGVYIIPGQYNDRETVVRLMAAGPQVMLHIRHEGMAPMEPGYLVTGILHTMIFVSLIALIMRMLLPVLDSYMKRLRFTALAGFTATFFTALTNPVWWGHPWPWHLVSGLYFIVSWVIAGAILAAFVKATAGAGRSGQKVG